MKKLISLACLCLAVLVSAPAFAGAQQDKMKGCNKEARGKTGDLHKAFMNKCLKKDYVLNAGDAPAVPVRQLDKMKSCNEVAATKRVKGEARRQFVSACLKKG